MDFEAILGNALRSAVGPTAAVYCLAAVGLNLHYGYTGLLNFGQVGFMLVGAYGMAVTVGTYGLSLWLGIAVGLGLAVGLALLMGVPTLRLRIDYFAITTIAAAEILRFVVRSGAATEVTGGPFGIQGIAGSFFALNPFPNRRFSLGISGLTFSAQQLWTMTVTWGLVALATLLIAALIRSPWGRVLKSVREDEDVARALGKNVFAFKMQSLVVGGVLGGLAGIMFALGSSSANANSYQPTVTFFAYAILILGGAATKFGPVVGAVLFWFLYAGFQSLLRQADAEGLIPGFLAGSEAVGALSLTGVGLTLMALMIFRPQGIFGDREEMRLDA